MRPIFDEEVAREIGYQKYQPDWKDWVFGVLLVLACALIGLGFIMVVLNISGNWIEKQYQPSPCSYYADWEISRVPVRCATYFGVGKII